MTRPGSGCASSCTSVSTVDSSEPLSRTSSALTTPCSMLRRNEARYSRFARNAVTYQIPDSAMLTQLS